MAVAGWLVAFGLLVAVVRLRRALELVADAAHELRGPVAALGFAVVWLRREPGGMRRALRFEAQLERLGVALADLDAARAGHRVPSRTQAVALERLVNGAAAGWRGELRGAGRAIEVDWAAGHACVQADRGRLAQAFGNLVANAAEHGSGPIEIQAVRKGPRSVRVEVRDGGPARHPARRRATAADRGRGLGIAERAVRDAGGRLELTQDRDGTVAAIELPLAGEDPR
jgi:signal transduction histidine kinase